MTPVAGASTVIVEEEGWLPDGTPLIVDDVEPSAVGDHGVWFLDALDDADRADLPAYLVINSQGRLLERDDRVVGGDQTDPLVLAIQQWFVRRADPNARGNGFRRAVLTRGRPGRTCRCRSPRVAAIRSRLTKGAPWTQP